MGNQCVSSKEKEIDDILRKCARMFPSSQEKRGKDTPLHFTRALSSETLEKTESSQSIDRYRLLSLLGEGGMGKVYRAFDPSLDRVVALKVLRPEAMADESALRRFVREAHAVAQLRHPHIVSVYDFQQLEESYFLVMQFVAGFSLEQKMRRERLSTPKICRVMLDILDALAYAEKKGIIHRDLKPANILLDEEENLFIADFGLAKVLGGETTQISLSGQVLGTPAYMAPEQAKDDPENPVDAQSDIYSVGVILYEMLTGRTPFEGTSWGILYKLLREDVKSPESIAPSIPEELQRIVMKALEKDKKKRYLHAADMAEDIRTYMESERSAFSRPVYLKIPGRIGRRVKNLVRGMEKRTRRAAKSAAALFVVLGLTVGYWMFSSHPRESEPDVPDAPELSKTVIESEDFFKTALPPEAPPESSKNIPSNILPHHEVKKGIARKPDGKFFWDQRKGHWGPKRWYWDRAMKSWVRRMRPHPDAPVEDNPKRPKKDE